MRKLGAGVGQVGSTERGKSLYLWRHVTWLFILSAPESDCLVPIQLHYFESSGNHSLSPFPLLQSWENESVCLMWYLLKKVIQLTCIERCLAQSNCSVSVSSYSSSWARGLVISKETGRYRLCSQMECNINPESQATWKRGGTKVDCCLHVLTQDTGQRLSCWNFPKTTIPDELHRAASHSAANLGIGQCAWDWNLDSEPWWLS